MSSPDLRQPGLVALKSRVWIQELTLELERLGFDTVTAERSAKNVLVHVVGRARWPTEAFVVDDRGELT